MVYAFLPQGRNNSIVANTNNPPQGEVEGAPPPPVSEIETFDNAFEGTGNITVEETP